MRAVRRALSDWGADMQKFLFMPAHADDRCQSGGGRCPDLPDLPWMMSAPIRVNIRRQVRQRQRLGLGVGQRPVRESRAAHGRAVAARNIFPSNIQGLPTWYEVRVCEDGWRGRRGGVDLMVAMNPQTWEKDVAEVDAGGYLFYDSTKALPPSRFRDDVVSLGIPITGICNAEYTDARQRQLFKNIIYLGALSAFPSTSTRQKSKPFAAVQGEGGAARIQPQGVPDGPRLRACPLRMPAADSRQAQRSRRRPHFHRRQQRRGARQRVRRGHGGRVVSDHAVVIAGRSVHELLPQVPHGSCHQAEAVRDPSRPRTSLRRSAWSLVRRGTARAFTTTSGPGVSLMQEFLGLAYFAEVPVVLFDVQRGSPSTGMPTRTQQADLLCCAYASHGDTKHVLLLPEDPTESFAFAAQAFDLADRLQTPIFVMLDLDIGMQDWLCEPFEWDDSRRMDRGKIMTAADLDAGRDFGRYLDVEGDGIPYRTYPALIRPRAAISPAAPPGSLRQIHRGGVAYVDNMQRLLRKFETAKALVPAPVIRKAAKATGSGVIWFGSTGAAMAESLAALELDGIHPTRCVCAVSFVDAVHEFILARPCFPGRAEPRCADEGAARQRMRRRPGEAHFGASLRRHADHGSLHHARDFRKGTPVQRNSLAQGGPVIGSDMLHRGLAHFLIPDP
jgi:2-oxoglutarate ferredoxin oxidoreductase subunit alpha